jgi:hypothetical protein
MRDGLGVLTTIATAKTPEVKVVVRTPKGDTTGIGE